MVHTGGQFPNSIISRIAEEDIGFGIAVSPGAAADLTAGEQSCELTAVTDLEKLGITIADTSKEAAAAGTAQWNHEESVSILKQGQIWVDCGAAITTLVTPVYVHNTTGAVTPTATTATECTGMKWIAYETDGTTHFGLVQVDL
jgi:hypothetical protein